MEKIIPSLFLTACVGYPCSVEAGQGGITQAQLASTLTDPAPQFRVAEDRPGRPIIAMKIHRYYATDAVLERLKAFPELEELGFTEGGMLLPGSGYDPLWRVTDAGVAHLKNLKRLRSLSLPSSKVTDAGMAHLGEMTQLKLTFRTSRLRYLRITSSPV